MYSKQICESDKNVHEILENIKKTKKNASLWLMRFVFKVCRAVASSLPWDLPCRLHCDHMDIASIISKGWKKDKLQHGESLCQNKGRSYIRILSHTYLVSHNFFISGCNARAYLLVQLIYLMYVHLMEHMNMKFKSI